VAFRLFVPAYEALPTSSLEQDGKPELGFGPRISRDDSANESRNQVPAAHGNDSVFGWSRLVLTRP